MCGGFARFRQKTFCTVEYGDVTGIHQNLPERFVGELDSFRPFALHDGDFSRKRLFVGRETHEARAERNLGGFDLKDEFLLLQFLRRGGRCLQHDPVHGGVGPERQIAPYVHTHFSALHRHVERRLSDLQQQIALLPHRHPAFVAVRIDHDEPRLAGTSRRIGICREVKERKRRPRLDAANPLYRFFETTGGFARRFDAEAELAALRRQGVIVLIQIEQRTALLRDGQVALLAAAHESEADFACIEIRIRFDGKGDRLPVAALIGRWYAPFLTSAQTPKTAAGDGHFVRSSGENSAVGVERERFGRKCEPLRGSRSLRSVVIAATGEGCCDEYPKYLSHIAFSCLKYSRDSFRTGWYDTPRYQSFSCLAPDHDASSS